MINKKALIIRIGSLGDNIILNDIFCNIKDKYQNIYLLSQFVETKIEYVNLIDLYGTDFFTKYYFCYNNFDILRKIFFLSNLNLDIFYLMPVNKKKTYFIFYFLLKIFFYKSKIYGFGRSYRNYIAKYDNDGRFEYEADRINRLLSYDNFLTTKFYNGYNFLSSNFSLNKNKYIVVSVTSRAVSKLWPFDRWDKIFDYILNNSIFDIYLFCSSNELKFLNGLIKNHSRIKIISRNDISSEHFDLIKHSEFFIGLDSAWMHVANMFKKSGIIIFSSQGKYGRWMPKWSKLIILYNNIPCQGCELKICKFNEEYSKCMANITVSEVIYNLRNLLFKIYIFNDRCICNYCKL